MRIEKTEKIINKTIIVIYTLLIIYMWWSDLLKK